MAQNLKLHYYSNFGRFALLDGTSVFSTITQRYCTYGYYCRIRRRRDVGGTALSALHSTNSTNNTTVQTTHSAVMLACGNTARRLSYNDVFLAPSSERNNLEIEILKN